VTLHAHFPPGYKQPRETASLLRIIAAGFVVTVLLLLILFR
jgi:hypothetical protein